MKRTNGTSGNLPKNARLLVLRRALTVSLALFAAFAMVRHAQSALGATPTPAPTATTAAAAAPVAAACPAAVLRYLPLDSADVGGARTYAVAFETFSASPGKLSGTVTMFAGSERYDVPFAHAVAVPATFTGALTAVPLIVRLPAAVKIDSAYLSAIVGPNPGPCEMGYIAMRSNDGVRARELSELDRVLRARAQDLKPIDAPAPTNDPVACERPNVDANVAFAAAPHYPDLAGRRGDMGETQVAVALGADNTILAAWVWKSAGSKDLDQAAITAAYASRFNAATFRCRRVFGLYTFYADFQE